MKKLKPEHYKGFTIFFRKKQHGFSWEGITHVHVTGIVNKPGKFGKKVNLITEDRGITPKVIHGRTKEEAFEDAKRYIDMWLNMPMR